MPTKDIKISVFLSPDTHARARSAAFEKGLSLTQYVASLVEGKVTGKPKAPPRHTAEQAARKKLKPKAVAQ